MNTYSEDFSNLIHKLPSEESSLRCLENLISKPDAKNKEYTLRRLFELCHPSSLNTLNTVLEQLTNKGILKKKVRLISPRTGSLISSYDDVGSIPIEIYDPTSDLRFETSLDNVEIVYILGD